MRNDLSLGRLFGINIRLDWSWLFIFFLITWNLASSFSRTYPGWGTALIWGAALAASLLFFVSVLAHELAHSLVARAQGIPVRNITLFLFGGVSNIQREPPSPRAEFLITIVGPITSLVIGFLLLFLGGRSVPNPMTTEAERALASNPLSVIALWLGSVNILLGIFNLIPGFPLDGGRVLRSILWATTGSLRKATRWASYVGQAIAWLFIIAGVAIMFGADLPLFGSGFINGLWITFIGWFLNGAAVQSYQQVVIQDVLGDISVARLMRTTPPTVPAQLPVSELVYTYAMREDDYGFPVMDDRNFVGLVTLSDVRSVSRDMWDTTTVREIMTPVSELVVTTPDEDVAEALNKLAQRDVRQLPVMRGNEFVGLLRRQDIMRWMQLHSDLEATA